MWFGDKIRVVSRQTEHDETEWVANDILHRRLVHGFGHGDFAVLKPGRYVICAVTGKKVPLEALRYWNATLQEAYAGEPFVRVVGEGVSPAGGAPEQFGTLIRNDIDMWRKVVQKAGIKAE